MESQHSVKLKILDTSNLIPHRFDLLKYLERDRSVNDFIRTLMENDLRKLFSKYPNDLMAALVIVQFAEMYFPKDSWGSVMNVSYWLSNND